jgi:hypothetical protein
LTLGAPIEASNGVTYAFRRFGNPDRDVPPALFLQHFRANLDQEHASAW